MTTVDYDDQDHSYQAVPGLSEATRLRLCLGHADQPLGPGDNFDLEKSHMVPALIRKMHAASVPGSGKLLRDLLHVDDLDDALLFLMG